MSHPIVARGLAAAAALSLLAGAAAAQAPESVSAHPEAATVAAVINGQEITLGELSMMREDLPEQYRQLPTEQLIEALLSRVAVEVVMSARAIEAGLDQDPDVLLREKVQTRSRLAEAQMRDVLRAAVTEDALKAAYDEAVATMEPTAEIRASHILVAEKEMAEDLLAQLNDGADFAALAAEHGTDGTKTRGGDLGWFEKGQMVPEFAEAAFAGEEGAYVGPVETQFGWHLIHVTGKRDKPIPSLEEMRPALTQQLTAEAANAAIADARAEAVVIRPEPAAPEAAPEAGAAPEASEGGETPKAE